MALLCTGQAVTPSAAASAAQRYLVYWDQNEEEGFYASPSGATGTLIPPWDPNGQMCLLPDKSGRFVTGYNPTTADQHNPGSKKPKKNPPVGEALWDRHGRFTGTTIHVPGPYHLKGSKVGGDIPPDKGTGGPEGGGHFNSNGTMTGCVFDSHANLFATDIGTAQGQIPVPDNGRLIEWFAPAYTTYCILFGPTSGGVGPHHVDGSGGLRDPGTIARDTQNNVYVPEPGNSNGSGVPDSGRVLRFLSSTFPKNARACPAPSNMPKKPVKSEVFVQGGSQGVQQVPSGIARDPSCSCWAVTSVFGNPAIAWYDDQGKPFAGKGPVPAGNYSPFGITVAPDGTTYFADIHLHTTQNGLGPQDGAGAVYKVTFTNGIPNQPQAIGTGFSFPVSVTVCVPSKQACPLPKPARTARVASESARPTKKPSLVWPTFGRTQQRSFHGTTTITPSSAPTLQQRWFVSANDAVTATPIVANGVVYVGSWDGVFRAVTLSTGKLLWKFTVKSQPAVHPVPGNRQPQDVASDGGIITSSAAYVPRSATHPALVVFGGGYTLYALNAATGKPVWEHDYTGAPQKKPDPSHDPTRIFTSPAVVGNQVLFGTTNDGQQGYHGYAASASLLTGKPQWAFQTDAGTSGRIANNGCDGVWSSPTVDARHRLVFLDTADCGATNSMPFSEVVFALHYRSGKLAWVFHPPRKDPGCDWDFGATPNFRYGKKGGSSFLGVGGKDGTYYSLSPTTGKLRWRTNVVYGGTSGGFIATAALDGNRVYGATAIGELGGRGCNPSDPRDTQIQEPSMHAFDAKTGKIAWQAEQSQAFGATTVAGGMTFVCTAFSQQLQIRDASNGNLIYDIPLQSGCNSGVVVAGNMVIFGEGTAENPQQSGIALYTPGGAAPKT